MLVPQPVVLGSSAAQTTVVAGNLTVCGSTSLPGGAAAQSLAVGTGGITDAGALTVQGATVLNNTLNVAGNVNLASPLSSQSSLTAAGAILSGSATLPGGSFLGYNGSSVVAANHPFGLAVGAVGPGFVPTATVNAAGAVVAQSAELIGDLVVRGGYVGSNGAVRQPAVFPLGMVGGQNSTVYLAAQPTNGVEVEAPPVTWNGSPINIQLQSNIGANAANFYNIILPVSLQTAANAGKIVAFGNIYIGGTTGVAIRFYNGSVSPANLITVFGMAAPLTGGAYRGFQCIYEPGNPYIGASAIHSYSFAGILSQ